MGMARRLAFGGLGILAGLVILAVAAVLVMTNTPWGREQLRSVVLRQAGEALDGDFSLARIDGNLLRGVSLVGLSVTDREGRPFLTAERVRVGYSILPLLRQRLVLTGVELEEVHLVLDQPPGEAWNFVRIFNLEPDPEPDPGPGWGDWVSIRDIGIRESRITIRTEWTPDEELPPAAREQARSQALAGETMEVVVEVPGGLQQIMDLQEVDADLPGVVVSHPDYPELMAEVAALRTRAYLFQGPPALVERLAGVFRVGDDLLAVEDLELELPQSLLSGEAVFHPETGTGRLALAAQPVALQDLRFLQEDLPGTVAGDLVLTGALEGGAIRVEVEDVDLQVGEGRLQGRGAVHLEESLRSLESDLRFSEIDTRFLQDHVPGLTFQGHGRLDGHLRAHPAGNAVVENEPPIVVDGLVEFEPEGQPPSRLTVEGTVIPSPEATELRVAGLRLQFEPLRASTVRAMLENAPDAGSLTGFVLLDGPILGPLQVRSRLSIHHPQAGPSQVQAAGGVSLRDGLAFHAFDVAFAPVELQAVEAFTGELPVGGSVELGGRMDGRLEDGLAFQALIRHEDGEAVSVLDAAGRVHTADGGHFQVDLGLLPVSLATVGHFVPAAGLQGEVHGMARAEGDLDDLAFQFEFHLPGDGLLTGTGRVAPDARETAYRTELQVTDADLAAISRRVEVQTAIYGTVLLAGEGTDPGSAQAALTAELVDRQEPGERNLAADLVAERGLLRVQRFALETEGATARAEGTLGLSPGQEGELAYEIVVDSLGLLEPFLPEPEEGVLRPRPAVHHAAAEERRRELEGAARAAHVEYLATGESPPLPQAADTLLLLGVRRDALAGTLAAQGRVHGNLERLGIEGDLVVDGLLALGHRVDRAEADYQVDGIGGQRTEGSLALRGEGLYLAGFGYEGVEVEASYQGYVPEAPGSGDELRAPTRHAARLAAVVDQDPSTRLRTALTVEAEGDTVAVHLEEAAMELADADYALPQPATVRWTGAELEIRDFRIEGRLAGQVPGPGALVQMEGVLPREGDGSLEARIEGLPIPHLLTLAQAGNPVTGRIWLEFPVRGSLASPVFQAEALVEELHLEDRPLPDVRAALAYQERELEVEAELRNTDTGEPMLQVEAQGPVDLSLTDPAEERLLAGPIQARAWAEALDLSVISSLTDQVESAAGRADLDFRVAGTFDQPELSGSATMEMPSLYLVPLGIPVRNVAASLTMADDVIRLDSLVAHSRGPLRVAGEVLIPRGELPAFDLELEARDVQAMDTRDVQMRVDADVQITGPFDQVEVGGEVRARRGVVRIPETEEFAAPGPLDLQDPATFARVDPHLVALRDAILDTSPFMENLRVDVNVHIDRDVWVRSSEANIELFTPPAVGPLRVQMNGLGPRNLSLEGTIHTGRGEYAFMGRRFDLARGTVIFGPEDTLDPLVRLTAEHEVQMPGREAFDIRIIVDGTLTELDTELESTTQPPLSQTDLLSFVVFGRDAGSLLQSQGSGLSGQGSSAGPLVGAAAAQAAQRFATVGMQALVTEAEGQVARALGLDVLHIQPADLPAEISSGELVEVLRGTEVEAGAYVTPRLFISGNARPTFVHPGARIEYQTDHGWTWRATWRPRYLPAIPTLSEVAPDRASVLGTLILREWRF